jgi:class 3 adenylate cyclase/tetratricopeptide (TPR) repeat protein
MKCSNCGAGVSEGAKFCSQCGFALPMRCPSCGTAYASGAKFCAECGTKLDETSPPVARTTAPGAAPVMSAAERRHLTVMFCDLVGSTELSTRLELEDLQELIGGYQKTVAEVVTGFGGFVARRVGDGSLVYFGYPQVGEDDAEQAVRAGLALIEHLKLPGRLQVRIGIATGLMVVEDAAQNQEVVGETPNLAARLHALAEPNTLVIADSTRRLLGSLFEVEDLGLQALKGFPRMQRSWRVLGETQFKSRFEALRSSDATLVGRNEEIELLLRRWEQIKTGEGRVILISAEPGVGKSRLTTAMVDRLGGEAYTNLRYFCLPHHEASALFPFINQLERAACFEPADTPQQKLDKLEALVAAGLSTDEDVPLLADLLLLPTERYPPLALTPLRKREKTLQVLLRQLTSLAERKPVLVIFEDLHWMDPTSRELLDLAVERIERLPVLLIATFRPEFQPPWTDQSHVTTMTLGRLNRHESAALVRLLTHSLLPEEVIEQIVARGEGTPLFLEEVAKAVLETGVDPAHRREVVLEGMLSVPLPLYASLMARLERLGPLPREIAQIGAVIGREFSFELLAIVAQRPEAELKDSLARLVDMGLLLQRGELPSAVFLFKHALVQDTAYSTLLRGPRRQLHARVAQALEDALPDTVASRPELVARHFTEAALPERAILYWQRAGELALRGSAAAEALKHLSNALRCLEAMPDTPERARQELNIRLRLGTALNIARGSSDPEAAEHSARAIALARTLDDDDQLFKALWGGWYVKTNSGRTEEAFPLANELFKVAERLSNRDLMLEAYHSRWATSHLLGLNSVTLEDTERGIALYERERHHVHAYDYGGHDTGVCAYTHRAMTLWIVGLPDQAAQVSNEAIEHARRLGHPPSLAHAAWWSATLRQFLRQRDVCRELCELTLRIAQEQNTKIFMMCPLLLGWVLFHTGKLSEGLLHMEQVIAGKRQRSHRYYYDYELLVFAEALLKAGEPDRARDIVEEALEFVDRSRIRVFQAEAQRLKGECLAALAGDGADAETWLANAIATAAQQGALSFELRAATSLARIWSGRGRHDDARELVARVYDRFTEGLETADLKDAKAFLGHQEAVLECDDFPRSLWASRTADPE